MLIQLAIANRMSDIWFFSNDLGSRFGLFFNGIS